MSDLNLYNVVDNLVMVRNSLNDFVNSKVKDIDSGEIHFYISKLNKEIKNVQKFYPYVDYDKMISDDR
tara:strand:- start:420 stop:623 length:204 start_codon:yes stop_codon:yes gene_type:complete